MASQDQIDGLKAKAQELLDAVSALSADSAAQPAPAPASGSDQSAPVADATALKVLQDKVDALASENKTLRDAIQAEIDDEKADTARLEAALAPVAEPAPVPVVSAETVADPAKAESAEKSPDEAAKPVSAGI